MSNYTPVYSSPYGNFVNAPPYETPVTAEVMNMHNETFEHIEKYLVENPIETPDMTEYQKKQEAVTKLEARVYSTELELRLKNELDEIIDSKVIKFPQTGSSGGSNTADLTVSNSISMGRKSGTATGGLSTALGYNVTASGNFSVSEGKNTIAGGECSHAEGSDTESAGKCAHAEGSNAKASGNNAHAEGGLTKATEYCTHAEGYQTEATGEYGAHAEGQSAKAGGTSSHAEGQFTIASGNTSHAEGSGTEASSYGAHAEGMSTKASGAYSHAEGSGTIAAGTGQHVQGNYNIEDTNNKYAHVVGNGTFKERSNAHTLDWSGNAWYKGTVESAGVILSDTADSTKRYLLQITDGQLAVSEITQ